VTRPLPRAYFSPQLFKGKTITVIKAFQVSDGACVRACVCALCGAARRGSALSGGLFQTHRGKTDLLTASKVAKKNPRPRSHRGTLFVDMKTRFLFLQRSKAAWSMKMWPDLGHEQQIYRRQAPSLTMSTNITIPH